jgi:hypothetical protein
MDSDGEVPLEKGLTLDLLQLAYAPQINQNYGGFAFLASGP